MQQKSLGCSVERDGLLVVLKRGHCGGWRE
jgi:hypothetical protein